MNKILITGGCSFSDTTTNDKTWPFWLAEKIKFQKVVHTGFKSQGNGMISRKVIHAVHNVLKENSSDDLLVGIMWSGPDRHEQYINHKIVLEDNIDNWFANPITFVDNDPGSWVIYNAHWKIPYAKNYYKFIHDSIFSQIQTLEHVIRVQNYLKLHKIKYFMSTYTSSVFSLKNNPNLDHLYEQIDFDKFLPVEGEFEWVRDYSNLPLPYLSGPGDNHPSPAQHNLFVENVIQPFLKQHYNIG